MHLEDYASATALVTGAGNGLGRAMALKLGEHCQQVVLVGRNLAKLEETAALMPSGRSVVLTADVSDADQVAHLQEACQSHEVSILVNNAGIGGPVEPLTEISVEQWDEVFGANVRSIFLMCRAFIPSMVERGTGQVINIASVSGKRPLVLRTPYAASKMAVLGLTRTLAFEVGPLGVSVNSLSPGPVRGPRMERNFAMEARVSGTTEEAAERTFVSRAALGRMVEEDEVAAALVAMLQMPGMCGADIDLSAGMVAPS